MKNTISERNSNDKRGLNDLQWCEELYQFLQGEGIENQIPTGLKPKLSPKKAFHIIWFLQEHLRIIPDTIERCENCDSLYDSESEGLYIENPYKRKHNFCGGCMDLVPEKYL